MNALENIQKPTIAIAGSSGRFGSRLKHYLSPYYSILSLQRTLISKHEPIQNVLHLDITDNNSVENGIKELVKMNARTLINCIGELNIDEEERTRGDKNSKMYRVNTIGPEKLAGACQQQNLKLIHLSTEYVFDGRKPIEHTYTEIDEPNVSLGSAPTWYGVTKALGEKKVLAAYPNGSVIVRLSQIQSPIAGLFISTVNKLGTNQPFSRANNQMMSPLTDHTTSEAIIYIENAIHRKNLHGIIHVSAQDAYSCYEVSCMLASAYGWRKKAEKLIMPAPLERIVESREQKVLRPLNAVLDTSKFNKLFGSKILTKTKDEIAKFYTLYPHIINDA